MWSYTSAPLYTLMAWTGLYVYIDAGGKSDCSLGHRMINNEITFMYRN
jgi:hypothetical protein